MTQPLIITKEYLDQLQHEANLPARQQLRSGKEIEDFNLLKITASIGEIIVELHDFDSTTEKRVLIKIAILIEMVNASFELESLHKIRFSDLIPNLLFHTDKDNLIVYNFASAIRWIDHSSSVVNYLKIAIELLLYFYYGEAIERGVKEKKEKRLSEL